MRKIGALILSGEFKDDRKFHTDGHCEGHETEEGPHDSKEMAVVIDAFAI